MRARAAFRDGISRVNEAPLVLGGVVLATLLVAMPLSIVLRGAIETHLGPSAAAELAAEGTNYEWWQEFTAQTAGFGRTFTPSVIGFAAVLENASGLLDHQPMATGIAAATVAWLAVWSFLTGGVIDRYARRRPTRAYGFFGACGTHFWRFVRVGIIAWLAWLVLFGTIHGWVLGSGYARLTQDMTVERTAFGIRVGGYLLYGAILASFALLFDFARIRMVVEDRRSAVGAVLAAGRFIRRHARRVCGLFLLNAAAFLTVVAAYGALSAAAARTDMHIWLVLALGQAYIVARHYIKLLAYASETALFQGALAHAAYTAAPSLVWPDSPAVEAVTNAEPAPFR